MKYADEINKLYDELGDITIGDLYKFSCLISSGFDKKIAYNLISVLEDLWLKDENGYSLGKLSDMLYAYIEDHPRKDISKMYTRDLLVKIYDYD